MSVHIYSTLGIVISTYTQGEVHLNDESLRSNFIYFFIPLAPEIFYGAVFENHLPELAI